MRFLISIFICLFLLTSPAQAENLLKQLGKGLNRLGQNVERGIKRIDKSIKKNLRPKTTSETTTRTCVVYNKQGLILDEEICSVTATCTGSLKCSSIFVWPSGNKTFVETKTGSEPHINGAQGYFSGFAGIDCVTNSETSNRFCWMDPGRGKAPQNPNEQMANSESNSQITRRKLSDQQTRHENSDQKRRRAEAAINVVQVQEYFANEFAQDRTSSDADRRCEIEFVDRVEKIYLSVPLWTVNDIRNNCRRGAEKFQHAIVRRKANQLVAKTSGYPATLKGLKNNNWFRLSSAMVSQFSSNQQRQISALYSKGIETHWERAMTNAQNEILAAFQRAKPNTESAKNAYELCTNFSEAPKELAKTCQEQVKLLDANTERNLCRLALANSGANPRMLGTPAKTSGSGYQSWSIRKVICSGIKNRPLYVITIGNGLVPFFTSPSLQIYEGEEMILDVTFRTSTSRDDRSFTKMLVDIATGENEKDVPETLVGNNIRFKAPHIKWSNPESIIGCVLGFRKCD